jgi:hypothetical protein
MRFRIVNGIAFIGNGGTFVPARSVPVRAHALPPVRPRDD